MAEVKKVEESGATNWAEESDHDEDEGDQVIGQATAETPEEVKAEVVPAKVYNLPERKRNKYGDFVVTDVKVKERVVQEETKKVESGSDEEEESSEEEEEDKLVEIETVEAKGK